jgi:hypothetical protein
MAGYDRDATIERQQIHEISLNVARRLRQVLDRNHYIPASMQPEVDSTVRVITGIQRDIDQIMAALPADEALDFAILTHIMGGQRHALDLLEILEEKLDGSRSSYQRDSARVHQALLAVSREIERDALRYAAEPSRAPPAADWRGPAHPPAPVAQRPAAPSAPTPRPPAKKPERKKPVQARTMPSIDVRAALHGLVTKPVPLALAALTMGVGLTVAALSLLGPEGNLAGHQTATALSPGQKISGRLEAAQATASGGAENVAITTPAMEQPYLVVLTTRRSTEELQQDYRTYKASYPDLLGSAKARVDRVQGQDRQTWYRLSLIPPQTREDAKTLCRDLRKAGLTGCWIKPVPLR